MLGTEQVFRYTATSFITGDTFVPASEMDICANSGSFSLPCYGVDFLPSGPHTTEHYPELLFQTLNPDSSIGSIFYYFPPGATFSSVGTLTNVPTLGNAGTLTISEAAPVAVPEPAPGLTVLPVVGFTLALWRRPRSGTPNIDDVAR